MHKNIKKEEERETNRKWRINLSSDGDFSFDESSIRMELEFPETLAFVAFCVTSKSFRIVFKKILLTTALSAIEANSLIVDCKIC